MTVYKTYDECISALYASADKKYDDFNSRIVKSELPTVGVRIPVIRAIARTVPAECRDEVLCGFFAVEERTFEGVMLAGLLAAAKGDYKSALGYMRRVIPTFSSWAHPDIVIPELAWAGTDRLFDDFAYLADMPGIYEVRSYVRMMFLGLDGQIDRVLDTIPRFRSGEYYIDMAVAWLLAECLVKNYNKALKVLQSGTLSPFVLNKAIQKARESFRISADKKEYLNTLKTHKR